jgi:hypothetical protein
VTAGEHQAQPIVREHLGREVVVHRIRHQQRELALRDVGAPPQLERAPRGDRRQPRPRPPRHALLTPMHQRLGVRVLHAVLGQIQIGRDPCGGSEDEGPLARVGLRHRRGDRVSHR